MIVSIMQDYQTHLDLWALASLKSTKNVTVWDNAMISKTCGFTVSFKLMETKIENGVYSVMRLNHTDLELKLLSNTSTLREARLNAIPIHVLSFQCDPNIQPMLSQILNMPVPQKLAYLLKSRRIGRPIDVFFIEDGIFLNSGNINISVEYTKDSLSCEREPTALDTYKSSVSSDYTKSKLITGIPESVCGKLASLSESSNTSINKLILTWLISPPDIKPPSPPAPKEPVVSKMISGIPMDTMKWMKDKAKAEGISVNRLILNLIGCDPAAPKEPKDTSAKSRLLTGIPPELLEKTAEAASNCGMSVNKYIIEVIKAGAI